MVLIRSKWLKGTDLDFCCYYYAFGWEMPGRKYNTGNYRHGFNGKENDREWGDQLIQDYGFRLYNPAIGKFLSVDPLAPDYPELTPYQFASNTPIWAIDLDGLEAFFIHGTMSNSGRWQDSDGNPLRNTVAILQMTNNNTIHSDFEWGGFGNYGNGPFNSKADRRTAAINLTNHIMANLVAGEDITLVGHSHGGNVAIQATEMIRNRLDAEGLNDVMINIISVNTPADNADWSPENLANQPIDNHIHFFNEVDIIQTIAANKAAFKDNTTFERAYTRLGTVNINLTEEVRPLYTTFTPGSNYSHRKEKVDGVGAHSFDFQHPEVLEEGIENGTIPIFDTE
jgi:RHS repeat-associated protein